MQERDPSGLVQAFAGWDLGGKRLHETASFVRIGPVLLLGAVDGSSQVLLVAFRRGNFMANCIVHSLRDRQQLVVRQREQRRQEPSVQLVLSAHFAYTSHLGAFQISIFQFV
jgi:hypothetical protein